MSAVKHNKGKVKLTLVPPSAIEAEARAMEFGMNKYGRDNYRSGFPITELLDACKRHVDAYLAGEDLDSESGLPHPAHARACLGILIETLRLGTATDDRYKPGHKESK